jgi:hypothetical protein
MLEYWNFGMMGKVEYRFLEGHAPSWPDATERVPPIANGTVPLFQHSSIPSLSCSCRFIMLDAF